MPVFFVYVHDGQTFSMDDLECSSNAESVRRELASRVRTGVGKSRFVVDMDELTPTKVRRASTEEEWPPATREACMVVWRSREWAVPTGQPDEIWQYSGTTDRPVIIPAELPEMDPVPTTDMRVSEDVFRRRVSMGWDPARARTTPLGHTFGSVRVKDPSWHPVDQDPNVPYVRRNMGSVQVHTAFGMTRSIAEWQQLTGISESALKCGASKHGMEEYLKKKQWHPRLGMP